MLFWIVVLTLASVALVAATAWLERRENAPSDSDRTPDPTRPSLVAPRRRREWP